MIRSLTRFALLTGLALSAGQSFAASDDSAVATLLPGGGVLSPDGKVGYFPNTSGGIDALDLADGKVLWSSDAAPRPLLASADRLFAQAPVKGKANQVKLIALDTTKDGKSVSESEAVTFPAWVSVGVTHGRSFRSAGAVEKGTFRLTWEARAWYAGGARPTPEIEKRARNAASGVAKIDVATGKVEMTAGPAKPIPAEPAKVEAGNRVLALIDKPSPKPFQKLRFLRAADTTGKELWQHPIAAPVIPLPLP